jgi:hypothetical protein
MVVALLYPSSACFSIPWLIATSRGPNSSSNYWLSVISSGFSSDRSSDHAGGPLTNFTMVGLSHRLPHSAWPSFLITPQTLFRWHRGLVRRKWALFLEVNRPDSQAPRRAGKSDPIDAGAAARAAQAGTALGSPKVGADLATGQKMAGHPSVAEDDHPLPASQTAPQRRVRCAALRALPSEPSWRLVEKAWRRSSRLPTHASAGPCPSGSRRTCTRPTCPGRLPGRRRTRLGRRAETL